MDRVQFFVWITEPSEQLVGALEAWFYSASSAGEERFDRLAVGRQEVVHPADAGFPVMWRNSCPTVRFNSARGRVKDKNIRRDARVAISLQDPANPYRYLEIRGRVVDISEAGADAHIDKLTQKYMGQPTYPYRKDGEVRVIYTVEADKTTSMG